MEKVILNVPEDVHIRISRFSPKAVDLKELVYSHILLPVRSHLGGHVRFEWAQPDDWIKFCNGEEVKVVITGQQVGEKRVPALSVRHGAERVVYVRPVLAEVE